MSKVTLEQLGLGADDLAAIGKLSESGMTPDEIAAAIKKIHDVSSSASGIDAMCIISDSKLAKLHYLVRSAIDGLLNDVKFIRVGDSTRNFPNSEWVDYDKYIFSQLNISYYNNANSGQTAYDWLNNIDQNTFSQLIANCSGTNGNRTIIEFSLGTNDYGAFGGSYSVKAQVKQILIDSINAIKNAKPDAYIYLASPHYYDNATRLQVVTECYTEIAAEMGLFLVNPSSLKFGGLLSYSNTDYYNDLTHLNQFGMLRLNFYILSKIFKADILKNINFAEYEAPLKETNIALGISILPDLWVSDNVDFTNCRLNNSTAYRHIEIDVDSYDFMKNMKYKHQGNRAEVYVRFNDDSLLRLVPGSADANGYHDFYVPANVKKIMINISSSGSSYDLLNDVVGVYYKINARKFIDYTEIIDGIQCNINHTNTRKGKIIDNYGKFGTVGQSLKIDSNNKMKWTS